MTTYHADDVTNASTGEAQGPTKPVTTTADWVPSAVDPEPQPAPKKTSRKK